MLARLEVRLKNPQRFDHGISSLMQGALMEHIEEPYVRELHESKLNPYSQHLEFGNGELCWVITTFTKETKEKIIEPILEEKVTEIYLKHKEARLEIISKTLETKAYKQLLQQTFFGDCAPYLNIAFITPTAFKVNGKYQFYPTLTHIFKSLIKRHDSIVGSTEVYSEDLIKQIEEKLEITKYNLRSVRFDLEGVKIPAFIGTISIRTHGPKQLSNLIHMLAEFGTYTGVGIKTSIGMGAIKLMRNDRKGSHLG